VILPWCRWEMMIALTIRIKIITRLVTRLAIRLIIVIMIICRIRIIFITITSLCRWVTTNNIKQCSHNLALVSNKWNHKIILSTIITSKLIYSILVLIATIIIHLIETILTNKIITTSILIWINKAITAIITIAIWINKCTINKHIRIKDKVPEIIRIFRTNRTKGKRGKQVGKKIKAQLEKELIRKDWT